jgi:hypothetical protein
MNFSILYVWQGGGLDTHGTTPVPWGPLRCLIYGTIQVTIKQDGRFVCQTKSYKAAMLQEFLYFFYAFQCYESLETNTIIFVHFSLLIDSIFNYAINSSRQHSVEWQDDKQIMKWKEYISSRSLINLLQPELNAQGTLQKTQDINGHPLFCILSQLL